MVLIDSILSDFCLPGCCIWSLAGSTSASPRGGCRDWPARRDGAAIRSAVRRKRKGSGNEVAKIRMRMSKLESQKKCGSLLNPRIVARASRPCVTEWRHLDSRCNRRARPPCHYAGRKQNVHSLPVRRSHASRKPSPRKFKDSKVEASVTPGKTIIHQYVRIGLICAAPSAMSEPRLACGG